MATIQDRPFSKDYSGLINQSVIAVVILTVCVASHTLMRTQRRGRGKFDHKEGVGSVETWEFGYLFQGRTWAKNPSPPLPTGWPLAWVKQAITFPEDKFNELRGVDASVYVRFLRGCFWFTFTHTFTTLPILLPIHVRFSDGSVSDKSMTRASISSLVATRKGLSLLWIHLLLLIWVTATWMVTLVWICIGAFRFRAQKIQEVANHIAQRAIEESGSPWNPHPHPQYPFLSLPPLDEDGNNRGLRLRTVMIANVPPGLRSEKDLKEYFQYYLSRPISKPSVGVPTTTQPGTLNTIFAFAFNRAKRIPKRLSKSRSSVEPAMGLVSDAGSSSQDPKPGDMPVIEKVVLVRKMDDLASLLERRENVLRALETAHIRLAKKTLAAVKEATEAKPNVGLILSVTNRLSLVRKPPSVDVELGGQVDEDAFEGEDRTQLLVRTLAPYVKHASGPSPARRLFMKLSPWSRKDPADEMKSRITDASTLADYPEKNIWKALLSLPRSALDAYQPLIHLSALFRGKTVPAIDYYTAKLNLLTSLITEKRAKAISDYSPTSTAFVTFADPADARRACKYLAVHPNNPLACKVTMAPSFEDLDWNRLMKPIFRVEFVKDWVVNTGVWGFTIFWLFPVSLFVGLVSIQNISAFWPGLKRYLDKHKWGAEVLQSLIPTLLLAGLAILVPLLLLLIAKKAHTITTLSALHDRIMTRYYKFLIVNVLVFFCVGVAALQSFLLSFKSTASMKLIQVVADSFPSAGPFYVGWLIFTMGMHGGFELGLFGLPLLTYPGTRRQVTPRKRAVGIRPRTFNYYYWLPNNLLVIHVLLVFSLMNPLVIPFGLLYFSVESTVIRNQLLHVYAKNYEGNGQILLVRLLRYSLDGVILSQVVFLAYMIVLKKKPNLAVTVVLIVFTVFVKMILTRVCRTRFEQDDILEAEIVCGTPPRSHQSPRESTSEVAHTGTPNQGGMGKKIWNTLGASADFWTLKLSRRMQFSYATIPNRPQNSHYPRNPFQPEAGPSSEQEKPPQELGNATCGLPQVESPVTVSPRSLGIDHRATPRDHPTTPLCSPHPLHPVWDDSSSPDHGYENPYYTRSITNELWLPRDPLIVLDLDDTVDLRISITSEPGAGKIGTWGEEDFIDSTLSLPSALSSSWGDIDDDDDETSVAYTPPLRRFTGNEVISLPAGIASRVESIDKEQDVDDAEALRPSIMRRRTPSNMSGSLPRTRPSSPPLSVRRPSNLDGVPSSAFRSFSLGAEGSQVAGIPLAPANSNQGSSGTRRRNRASTIDAGTSLRPIVIRPTSSQASRSFVENSPSAHSSQLVLSPRDPSIISTRDAVVSEVIVEEQEANQERLRQEEAELEKAKQPRSLLTAWMFERPKDPDPAPEPPLPPS